MPDTPDPHHPARAAGASPRLDEQRLASHVENTPLALIEWDHELRVVRWNAQAERLFGWAAAEVAGKTPLEWRFVHDDDRPTVERLMAEMFAGREPRNELVNRNYTRAGGVVWCEWHNSALYDAAGRLASVLSLVLDVTEHRATADALLLSQTRMRAALDGAKMLAWDLDLVANRWETTVDIPDFYGIEPGPDYSNPELAAPRRPPRRRAGRPGRAPEGDHHGRADVVRVPRPGARGRRAAPVVLHPRPGAPRRRG